MIRASPGVLLYMNPLVIYGILVARHAILRSFYGYDVSIFIQDCAHGPQDSQKGLITEIHSGKGKIALMGGLNTPE